MKKYSSERSFTSTIIKTGPSSRRVIHSNHRIIIYLRSSIVASPKQRRSPESTKSKSDPYRLTIEGNKTRNYSTHRAQLPELKHQNNSSKCTISLCNHLNRIAS